MKSRPRSTHVCRRAFTLTELMVAVLILIVVIVGTSKIFGTASKVTGLGQAGADVLQAAAAIERQLRADIQRLSREGFFAIRCVGVRNDVNVSAIPPGPLLNPALPPDHVIRADQLVFFTQGLQSIQTMVSGAGVNHRGQSTVARVYYGHAFQAPNAPAVDWDDPPNDKVWAIDPPHPMAQFSLTEPIVPWSTGPRDFVRTRFSRAAVDSFGVQLDYQPGNGTVPVDLTQPPAPRWLLARHAVILANDDHPDLQVGGVPLVSGSRFLGNTGARSARSIFINDPAWVGETLEILNGRVDAAASTLRDIRLTVLNFDAFSGDTTLDPWLASGVATQQDTIAGAIFYPRAERVAPGMHRVDQALTNNVISSACSSFIVDWTYEAGVGEILDGRGDVQYVGVVVHSNLEQPWFGLDAADELDDPYVTRGVLRFEEYGLLPFIDDSDTVFFQNIEQFGPALASRAGLRIVQAGGVVYEALFGYNQNTPLDLNGVPWAIGGGAGVAYTPWPSAIRITMTLHDTEMKLEAGREFQFIIDLPRRN